jgi:hypothetical protein
MADVTSSAIGLSELIDQVKADLLTPPKEQSPSFLYVESIELELQVAVQRDAKAGVKVDVVAIGGGEVGGGLGQSEIQKVKVKLSPLYTKEEMKQYFETFRPNEVVSVPGSSGHKS